MSSILPGVARPADPTAGPAGGGIRFDRNELAGAFGDIGTDLPLLVGVILAAGLDPASALTVFGFLQILTALRYRMPMPVQPLKAMAALVIVGRVSGPVLAGGGLAIGLVMLLLTVTGLTEWLARLIPKAVVRGIQLGLGLQLISLALLRYVPASGPAGYALAGAGLAVILLLAGNRRLPPALLVIGLGAAYAAFTTIDGHRLWQGVGVRLPHLQVPAWSDVVTGFILLAIPQLPLSLGNSILATRQVAQDFFPGRPVTIRGISYTYSIMNLLNPFLGGIPTCHGSGGMAGHYAFGARTGGSVILYGALYIGLGIFLSGSFAEAIKVFPLPILGVLLLVEGMTMARLVGDLRASRPDFAIAVLVGLVAVAVPYGYGVALVFGTLVSALVTAVQAARRRAGEETAA